jgi:long-chain acyl-CoA synthetase
LEWTVAKVISRGAASHPAHAALRYQGTTLSYGELNRRSNRVARGLLALGIQACERIAVLGKNASEHFDILFGASKAQAVFVPVNWRLSPREIALVLDDSHASVLFVGAEYLATLEEIRSSLKWLKHIFAFEPAAGITSYAEWMQKQNDEQLEMATGPDEVALQLYTSGTTGAPKGVMLTNKNLFTLFNQLGQYWRLDADTRSVVCLPLFHIGGVGWAMACMRYGGTAVLVHTFVAADVLRLIENERATHINLVPAMIRAMVESAEAPKHDYSSLRFVLYGTAPIAKPLLIAALKAFDCPFVQVYGLTETTSAVTQLDSADHQVSGPREALLRSAGRPYPWVEAKVVDPTTLEACPEGKTGELWVRSGQNMKGYWMNDAATAATIDQFGWLRTGDCGYLDHEGYLFLTDRVKDMIVSGGENVYPAESENLLAEHPLVAEAAVIGIPHPTWGETAKAVIVLKPGERIQGQELIDWLRERLAHYKCPTSVEFVHELPRNAAGKVLKRVLREPYWKGHTRRIG